MAREGPGQAGVSLARTALIRAPIPPPRDSGSTAQTDTPLHWAAYGEHDASRPPLLVLHGGPGAHHDYMLPQMLRLVGENELLFYDQRGGGRSRAADRTPITWRTHVGDLARVAGEFAVDPLTIVGYSWGGLLAMLYAIEASAGRTGSVPAPARMVLIDPAPVTRQYRSRFEDKLARRQRGKAITAMREDLAESGLREREPEAYRQRLFEVAVAGYFADPACASELTPFRVTGRVQQSVWESLGDFDIRKQLGTVRCPALVVHGREDPIPVESSADAAGALGARLVILERCGHVPYVEQPDALFAVIKRFLKDTE